MDTANNGESFADIWARVTSTAESGPAPTGIEDDPEIISGLISRAAECKAFYTSTQQRGTGFEPLFRSLYEASVKRLSRLQTLYFLSCGDVFPPRRLYFAPQSALASLRRAYALESGMVAMLISAAGTLRDARFRSCAADCARQTAESIEQIMRRTDSIMR